MSTHCDCCGVPVNASDAPGGIICDECADAQRNQDTETMQKRIERYDDDKEFGAQATLEHLCDEDDQ